MKNAILKSISATNFGPFNGTITFDMETSVPKGQIIENHTFFAGDNQQFNKIAYIYGANGSGKSNFCKNNITDTEGYYARLSEHQPTLNYLICFHSRMN